MRTLRFEHRGCDGHRAISGSPDFEPQAERNFFIPDIIEEIEGDGLIADRTREALLNRLKMAQDWDFFSYRYQEIWEVFDPKAINIVDLSTLDPGPRGRRNLVVDV